MLTPLADLVATMWGMPLLWTMLDPVVKAIAGAGEGPVAVVDRPVLVFEQWHGNPPMSPVGAWLVASCALSTICKQPVVLARSAGSGLKASASLTAGSSIPRSCTARLRDLLYWSIRVSVLAVVMLPAAERSLCLLREIIPRSTRLPGLLVLGVRLGRVKVCSWTIMEEHVVMSTKLVRADWRGPNLRIGQQHRGNTQFY